MSRGQRQSVSEADRFWPKVLIGDGCWEWAAGKYSDGYGQFGHERAHRVAYRLMVGPVPAGQCVMHRCDNRSCVRPGHLATGTLKDNYDDMVAKGRRAQVPRGESHWGAKLTSAAVLEIRRRRASGEKLSALAIAYGVAESTVSNAATGHRWAP